MYKNHILVLSFFCFIINTNAQGLKDGVYMDKGFFCGGVVYSHDAWDQYWEGTLLRGNKNIGTISTQQIAAMATYGITNNWNVLVSVPYLKTKASAGTLQGMHGFQDLTLATKYRLSHHHVSGGNFSTNIALGGSIPTNNYVADYLPLSIGLHCKTAFAQGMLHYQYKNGLTMALFGGYIWRSNVTLDRNAYYTTQLINANEAAMPAMYNAGARLGYYTFRWNLEGTFEQMACLAGNDIRRNDMPFLGNNMQMTRLGITGSYRIKALADTQLVSAAQYTIAGRNVGQSLTLSAGVMIALSFRKDAQPK